MLLHSFSIKNYRSIFEINDLEFSNTLTTFIGKNNQGKSNILKAFDLIFKVIKFYSEDIFDGHIPYSVYRELNYHWDEDFPIQRQNIDEYSQKTEVSISFELQDNELNDFTQKIGFNVSRCISFNTSFEKNKHIPILEILSNGVADDKLNNMESLFKITSWIISKVDFQYIPAIRTESLADDIASSIISLELSQLAPKKKEKLEEAIQQINELQKPILKKLEDNLSSTLKDFVPDIKNVSVNEKRSSYRYRRYSDDGDFYIKIDDGSDTTLSQKGDGVKSLITLGMMRQKGKNVIGKGLILAIEEPESHLHPEAIRQIGVVVRDIARNNQVIITSHSPLFVNRDKISDNIIVADNTASVAQNIKQIRDTFGCIASDNLINADFIIVVEGKTDKIILQKYLCTHSKTINDWITNKRLGFEVINGVYNLEHSLNKLLNMSSKYFCILDSDAVAKNCVKNAKNKSFLSSGEKEVCYYTLTGLKECELEDLIKPECYTNYIEEKTGIDVTECKEFRKSRKKWSERIAKSLKEKGKSYDEEELNDILDDVKKHICEMDAEIDEILISDRTSSITSFPEQIEKYFKNKGA